MHAASAPADEILDFPGLYGEAYIAVNSCAVRAAAESGEIAKSRYESYLRMHEEARKINDWE